MKKSKTISLFSFILFTISILYVILSINQPPTSIYKEGNNQITGIIQSCHTNENKTKIILKAKEKIIVNYYSDFNCRLGYKIKVIGKITKPNTFNNFNLFNYQKYLYSQKINYIIIASNIKIIEKKPNILYKSKNKLIERIKKYKSKNYLNTFILGDSKYIDDEVLNSYRSNGISHLLAISGMHITLLSIIILYLLNMFSKRKKLNYLFLITFLVFYSFLTSFSPSVIRATALFICITINKFLNTKIKTIYLLIIICSLFLIYNPFVIYNIGFLLSFITSFYLILFQKYIKNFKNYITKTFVISFIAFIVSTPIIINNFFTINLLAPLINLIFVPFVSFIIYPLSILTLILPFLDIVLFKATKALENLSLIINQINYFNIN